MRLWFRRKKSYEKPAISPGMPFEGLTCVSGVLVYIGRGWGSGTKRVRAQQWLDLQRGRFKRYAKHVWDDCVAYQRDLDALNIRA